MAPLDGLHRRAPHHCLRVERQQVEQAAVRRRICSVGGRRKDF
jgi:hypothetical protein